MVAQQGRRLSGDTVALDVTVSNTGDAVAFGTFGTAYTESGTPLWIDRGQWGDLADGGRASGGCRAVAS